LPGKFMKIAKIRSKTILSFSKVHDYALNPYVGCQHACLYCYARFMKKFSGHREPWGDFVDVKTNAPDLLLREVKRKRRGQVWVSGVCDPYQPLEAEYGLTRKCLEILALNRWPVTIQTRSPLVLRDLDILREAEEFHVGLSITSADDGIRKIFEPKAPPIMDRVETVEKLHRNGIRTFVMIAPVLPGAGKLVEILEGKVDFIIIDRMNYHYADWLYAKHGWQDKKTGLWFRLTCDRILNECAKSGIDCRLVFQA